MRPNSPRAQLTKKYALAESRCQPDDPASAGPSSSQTSSRRLLGVALGIGVYRRRAGFACTSPCKSRSQWARVALNMQVSRWLPPLSRSPRPADRPRSITRLRAPFRELSNSELNLSWAVRIERPLWLCGLYPTLSELSGEQFPVGKLKLRRPHLDLIPGGKYN